MPNITRRRALTLVGAGGLATACSTNLAVRDETLSSSATGSLRFRHGVASGDPDATSLIIWTRISTDLPGVDVDWRVATEPGFGNVVASGRTATGAERDFTVKALVTGLEPGKTYYYQFSADNDVSPTGRTRTLPTESLNKLGIALVSCSNFAFGYFNAYGAIARDDEIDYVLHTGDYIYEYGGEGGWGEETAGAIDRRHSPPHEIVTLQDYRTRHAQYKSDEGSRAMHAAHPLLCCWDDHESANNPWTGGAQNHQPDSEGSWEARRTASVQAYFEWMPIREPEAGRSPLEFWRTYVFGDLATLVTLETRHTGRGEQVDYAAWQPKLSTPEDYEQFRTQIIADPSRRMLSAKMEQHLEAALADSREMNQPWRLIGNAIPMARTPVPDLVSAGILQTPDDSSLEAHKRLAWLGTHNLPFYTDTWDGYPAARERFYDLCKSAGVQDLIVLTGDSHSFWLNQLADDLGNPMGVEIATAGVTSPGDFVESGFTLEQAGALDTAFAELLDEVLWTDNLHQGYVRLVFKADEARADFVAVRTVLQPDLETSIIRTAALKHDGISVSVAQDT